MKSLIYATPLELEVELVVLISTAVVEVRDMTDVFHNIRQSLLHRYSTCIAVGGRSFEQLL